MHCLCAVIMPCNIFQNIQHQLGGILSIYESSDEKGSCQDIFTDLPAGSSFKENRFNLGNGHAYLYKPFPE